MRVRTWHHGISLGNTTSLGFGCDMRHRSWHRHVVEVHIALTERPGDKTNKRSQENKDKDTKQTDLFVLFWKYLCWGSFSGNLNPLGGCRRRDPSCLVDCVLICFESKVLNLYMRHWWEWSRRKCYMTRHETFNFSWTPPRNIDKIIKNDEILGFGGFPRPRFRESWRKLIVILFSIYVDRS